MSAISKSPTMSYVSSQHDAILVLAKMSLQIVINSGLDLILDHMLR